MCQVRDSSLWSTIILAKSHSVVPLMSRSRCLESAASMHNQLSKVTEAPQGHTLVLFVASVSAQALSIASGSQDAQLVFCTRFVPAPGVPARAFLTGLGVT